MKHFSLMAATAALMLSACQNESLSDDIPSQGFLFTAATESYEGDTRTSLDADGNVLWKTGDQVSIFWASTLNEPYQVSDDSDGATTATLEEVSDGSRTFVSGTDLETNVAYYPYSAAVKIKKSGGNYALTVTLPATQTYAANSFGNGAFPMAAVTTGDADYALKFKNVLGGLKLQLKGTAAVKSIAVTGHNGEVLCGTATVTVSHTAKPSIAMTGTDATVTLDCGDSGVQLDATTATTFILALPPMTMEGGFTVVITATDNLMQTISTTKSQTITRSSLLVMPELTFTPTVDANGHAYVDLGLPSGTLWATMNVGATTPEGYGGYFAWGETKGKTSYDWSTYTWCDGTGTNMTKYCTDKLYGTIDDKTALELSDDAAHVNWGGSWHIPSKAQIQELFTYCEREWTTQSGVNGILVTSKNNSAQIFLPAAGYRCGGSLYGAASSGSYWSSALDSSLEFQAYPLSFDSSRWGGLSDDRCNGLSVRAVCP